MTGKSASCDSKRCMLAAVVIFTVTTITKLFGLKIGVPDLSSNEIGKKVGPSLFGCRLIGKCPK